MIAIRFEGVERKGLWQVDEEDLLRFRCRVGHAYSSETLLAEQETSLETALWTALRALEESAALARRLAARASARQQRRTAERFAEQAAETEQHAALIRRAGQERSVVGGAGGESATGTSASES